jgi:hypothetical protein
MHFIVTQLIFTLGCVLFCRCKLVSIILQIINCVSFSFMWVCHSFTCTDLQSKIILYYCGFIGVVKMAFTYFSSRLMYSNHIYIAKHVISSYIIYSPFDSFNIYIGAMCDLWYMGWEHPNGLRLNYNFKLWKVNWISKYEVTLVIREWENSWLVAQSIGLY